jgi:hypothetical protein
MMKRYLLFPIIIAAVLLFCTNCADILATTQVRFLNNSASKTVKPIWDGINMGALAPGQTSAYRDANPGNHTIKWENAANGKDLTTTAWPSLVQGQSYTFPYND